MEKRKRRTTGERTAAISPKKSEQLPLLNSGHIPISLEKREAEKNSVTIKLMKKTFFLSYFIFLNFYHFIIPLYISYPTAPLSTVNFITFNPTNIC
ncbi:MAG: hypothetical protein WCT48_05505, partial [Candidatus Paceibacterota bacterium]